MLQVHTNDGKYRLYRQIRRLDARRTGELEYSAVLLATAIVVAIGTRTGKSIPFHCFLSSGVDVTLRKEFVVNTTRPHGGDRLFSAAV